LPPSEFWQLSPTEFWWEFDAKVRANKRLEEMVEENQQGGGGFSKAEWRRAREAHSKRKLEVVDGGKL